MRKHELVLGFLLATALWVVILTLALDPTGYGEICEYTQAGQKECTTHHIILVVLWKTLKILNDAGVAITALATAFIAYFTFTLKGSTDKLWSEAKQQRLDSKTASDRQFEITQDSIKLARDEFLSTHRPKVRLKHLWLKNDIWSGEKIVVEPTLVNYGTSEGFGAEFGLTVHIVRADNDLPVPNIPRVGNLDRQKLELGKNIRLPEIDTGIIITNKQNVEIHEGRYKLYCVGYVSYFDGADRMRITGFCRKLTFPPNTTVRMDNTRFRRFCDPDYEYED